MVQHGPGVPATLAVLLTLCGATAQSPAATAAPRASARASSTAGPGYEAGNILDGSWLSRWKARDEREGAWVQVDLTGPTHVGAVILVDQANEAGAVGGLRLGFSDGSSVEYTLPPSPRFKGLRQGSVGDDEIDPDLPANQDPQYHRDKGPFLIRFTPRWSTFIRVMITEVARPDVPAGLAELRWIEVPDGDAQPEATPEEADLAARAAFGLSQARPTRPWLLRNTDLAVQVSPESGLVARMESLRPTRQPIAVGTATAPAMVAYLRNVDRAWEDRFCVLKAHRWTTGVEDGKPFRELTCVIAPQRYRVAHAIVRYRLHEDYLALDVRFRYLVDDWCRYRAGLYLAMPQEVWPHHRDCGGVTPTSARYIRTYGYEYDTHWDQGDWSLQVFPMDLVMRDDRFLVYGSFDLGPHLVFAPNVPAPGAYPSLFVMPIGIRKGTSSRFDLFLASLPKTRYGNMEALRWYCRRTRFHDPDLQGIPVRLVQTTPRTIPRGRIVGSHLPAFASDTAHSIAERERWMLKTGMTNLLYAGWDLWVHSPEDITTAGWSGYVGNLSADRLRREIARLRRDGFRTYAYMNQFVRPPWVPPDRLCDVDDDVEREWFIERVKAVVNTLKPDGIFWDAGWWPISWAAPNIGHSGNPRGSAGKGWLKIQALTYDWMKRNHPNTHVIMNLMAGGSPSQYFADAVIIEGTGIASRMLVEDSRALLTAVGAYHSVFYYDIFPVVLKEHGLTFEDTVSAGLPERVKAELWRRWIRGGMRAVGLGASLGGDPNCFVDVSPERRKVFPAYMGTVYRFPQAMRTGELDAFSAEANAVPVVADSFCVTTGRPDVFGSAWAAPERLLVSVYSEAARPVAFRARVDRHVLARYGCTRLPALGAIVVGPEGSGVFGRRVAVAVEPSEVVIRGTLKPGELVLVRSQGAARSAGARSQSGPER